MLKDFPYLKEAEFGRDFGNANRPCFEEAARIEVNFGPERSAGHRYVGRPVRREFSGSGLR
jgi:hypothetical protein